MEGTVDEIGKAVGTYVPNLLGALAILILGWIVARSSPLSSAQRWRWGWERAGSQVRRSGN